MLRKIPTFWLMVLGLMITSAVTLGLMTFRAIQTTKQTVENEQKAQLLARAEAHASAINEQLRAFENATKLAAEEAKSLMLSDNLSEAQIRARLEKYTRDSNNVYGSDLWYQKVYKPKYNNGNVSNVFLNQNTDLTPSLEKIIAATEDLDPVFISVHESNIGSQWIYLTLPDGMMRLFPWTASNSYPTDWEPQTITFYTVADAINDPNRVSVWTKPYNDFAGAGLMVTNSYPIYNNDTLMGVMSNDFVIRDIQKDVLGFKVGTNGLAFLLDSNGVIIAHKNFAPENTPLGEDVTIKLGEQEAYMSPVVNNMLTGKTGSKSVVDTNGIEWVVVYAPIPATNWHLGLMQPLSEIIQPATDIANQLLYGAILLVLLALAVSLVIARWISNPVTQLSKKAQLIGASVDAIDSSIDKRSTVIFKNTETSDIQGTKEISELAMVFTEMVAILRKRINELGSIYILGQTIASATEYEKTLQAVLTAVKRTAKSDFTEIYILQNGQWTAEISSQPKEEAISPESENTLSQDVLALVAKREPHLLLTKSTSADAAVEPELAAYMQKRQISAWLATPFITDGKVVGLVSLENYGGRQFTEDDQRQIIRLAGLASIAINNAIQIRQREQALKEKIQELKIEIDTVKKQREVSNIVESEYFQSLKERAAEIRARTDAKKKN